MTYDLAAIMNRAWELVRKANRAKHPLHFLLRNGLRTAWREARQVKRDAETRPVSDLSATERELISIENKNRLTEADYAEMERLRAVVADEAAMKEKRELIARAGGRFCAVTFRKADGSIRVMRIHPAKLKLHIKGAAASEAGRRAAETRTARHPHLMPVWDTEKRAPRSVNLATVSRIAVDGRIHEFRSN